MGKLGYSEYAPTLGQLWDEDKPFERIRRGLFSRDDYEKIVHFFDTIPVDSNDAISKEFVRNFWMIPIFLEWNRDRVEEESGLIELYQNLQNKIEEFAYKHFGNP